MKSQIIKLSSFSMIGVLFSSLLYAGVPIWTIVPNYSPVIRLPPDRWTTIEYLVTNDEVGKSRNLQWTHIDGITQVLNDSFCGKTFRLEPNASCVLALKVSYNDIPVGTGINSPVKVCTPDNMLCASAGVNLVAKRENSDMGVESLGIGKILILSDVHYNSLSASAASNPLYQNINYPIGNEDNPNSDPNQGMLDNFISQAATIANQGGPPDFIMINGDFLAHGLVPELCKSKCVEDTITYPLDQIWATANGVLNNIPIYPAIGNNDSYIGDYQISSTDGFFSTIGGIFAKYALPYGDSQEKDNFAINFNTNIGNYTVKIPTTCTENGTCQAFMVLNTVPYSNRNELKCWDNDDPVNCSTFQNKVVNFINNQTPPMIVSMHIGYAENAGANVNADYPLTVTNLFSKCSASQPNCIRQLWAGHLHAFSPPPGIPTYASQGQETLNTYLAPSVTPRNGAIPGFLIATYDRTSGKIITITSYSIPNYASVLAGKPLTSPIPFTKTEYQIQ